MLNSRDINLLRSDVAANCREWVARCKAAGLHVLVTNTVRDNAYQAWLYGQGRTRPGSIVTNSDTPTFHRLGVGLAFDFCKNVKGEEYSDTGFFEDAAAVAKEMGFSWGGDWRSFRDMPHIQWDDGGRYSSADIRAGRLPPEMPVWEDAMTQDQFNAMFKAALSANAAEVAEQPVSDWAREAWEAAVKAGLFDGTRPHAPLTRQEAAVLLDRKGLLEVK